MMESVPDLQSSMYMTLDGYPCVRLLNLSGEIGCSIICSSAISGRNSKFSCQNSLTSGVVLEDFDTVFTNKFYHSHLDDLPNINLSSIVAAASLVARTLYVLVSDTKNLSSSGLTSINVNTSLVEELVGCLLDCEPGLSCALVKSYISPAKTCPSHYVGVMLDEPSSTPYLGYVGDISSNDGEVCIRAETEGKGVCVVSTTRYVTAYSTRLKFESGTWTALPPNNSDPMGLLDAVWTESNWDVIGLQEFFFRSSCLTREHGPYSLGVPCYSDFQGVRDEDFETRLIKLKLCKSLICYIVFFHGNSRAKVGMYKKVLKQRSNY